MTIKQQGGIFGRNPTFNNVTIDGTLSGLSNLSLSGNIVLADGQGIDFSATSGTGTSELFDDYEEGTWTPTFTAESGSFSSITYSRQFGRYTKVGNMLHYQLELRTSAVSIGTASGNLSISGLPFTTNASAGRSTGAVGYALNWGGDVPLACMLNASSTSIFLFSRGSVGGNDQNTQCSHLNTGGSNNFIVITGAYQV